MERRRKVITVYGTTGSGNCYKPALLMRQLGIAYRWHETDTRKKESRTPEFLAKNPNGKVPLLEVDGKHLAESNAMLCYLAEGSPMLPSDRWTRAKVMEWMFFEQYSHEPYIATVRWWVGVIHKADEYKDQIAQLMPKGYAALGVMEQQLAKTPYMAGGAYTIADIALYAYTHVAHEGGFDMARYPAVGAWLKRVAGQPGYVGMEAASAAGRHPAGKDAHAKDAKV
jgi:glutathione S-transferase